MLMLLDQFVFLAILFLFPKRDLLLIFLSKTLETGNRKQIKIIAINKCENKSKSGEVLVFFFVKRIGQTCQWRARWKWAEANVPRGDAVRSWSQQLVVLTAFDQIVHFPSRLSAHSLRRSIPAQYHNDSMQLYRKSSKTRWKNRAQQYFFSYRRLSQTEAISFAKEKPLSKATIFSEQTKISEQKKTEQNGINYIFLYYLNLLLLYHYNC